MTKREIINEIMEINLSAGAGFLSRFSDDELSEYLRHLQVLREPRMIYDGDSDYQGREVVACEVPVASVSSQERQLGRWDEYLGRSEVKSQNAADDNPEIPPAPAETTETVDCTAARSEADTQAWLF